MDAAWQELAASLGEAFSGDPLRVEQFSRDASRALPDGAPRGVVLARDAADVRTAVLWANKHSIPVSVRGAGSGLSGGAVGYAGGLVISLAGLTDIIDIDPAARTAVVQPGVLVADLDAAANTHGLMYAPDPVSAEWCTIGGSVATNAGGLRCLAHGVTRDAVTGLQLVLGDGRLLRTGSATRKNSTGYDLTGLFVGSEGTLGVITEVTVRLVPLPKGERRTFRAEFASLRDAGDAVMAIMSSTVTPELLELLDANCLELIERHFPGSVEPGSRATLVGQVVGLTADEDAAELVRRCLAVGAVAAAASDNSDLLETRRRINPALSAEGLAASCDVAVPLRRLADMFDEIARIEKEFGVRVNTFAHAGDGNLHPALNLANDTEEEHGKMELVFDEITRAAIRLGGVVSGEHGIGSLKVDLAREQFDPVSAALFGDLKTLFDPNRILTPGRAI